jgi:NAD(P)H-nitrite reductase large subunit
MADLVCNHLGLTREDIIRVIKEKNLTTVQQILDETDAGSVCGTCIPDIADILDDVLDGKA